jgi:hypothetical protein
MILPMPRPCALPLILAAALAAAGCHAPKVAEASRLAAYDVEPWREVLAGSVRGGLVDYRILREAYQDRLDAYLDAVARFGPRSTPDQFPSRDDALAYYLNAYNALMLRKWLDAGAGTDATDRSVNLLWFVVDQWRVDGTWMSLNTLEQSTIRKTFDEPRIHFALVCGAVSCPPLADEPYEGPRLDAQLEAQGRTWLRDEPDALVVREDGTASLSMIFMWYFDDFKPWGAMPGVLERYLAPDDPRRAAAIAAIESGRGDWLPYSWTINDTRVRGTTSEQPEP